MDIYEYAILVFFSSWLILTVVFHFPLTGNYKLRVKDPFGIIPDWRFFCPTPIKHNYHILHREFLQNGDTSPWREIQLLPPRSLLDAIWNPGRKSRKSFLDITIELANVASTNKDNENVIIGSISYLTVLNYISQININTNDECSFIQFALMASCSINKSENTELLLLSKVHLIKDEHSTRNT
ncbi:hypothetical protein ABID42_001328 [Arcicella rosea]|uniref:hypothetical protein n=1 Tax=Arcicella rosea TaxID=502909 RepID=UPI00345CCC49